MELRYGLVELRRKCVLRYIVNTKLNRKRDNCRHGLYVINSRNGQRMITLVTRRSFLESLIALSAPSHILNIILPGSVTTTEQCFFFAGKGAIGARLTLQLIKVPTALPVARFISRVNATEKDRRKGERTNQISRSMSSVPIRPYIPLYNVTYSTVATLRLIKSVLTPAGAMRSFLRSLVPPWILSHENHGETGHVCTVHMIRIYDRSKFRKSKYTKEKEREIS